MSGREVASVGFFHHHDAVVLSEFPSQLTVPDIHGVNPGRAGLQEAIGETTGGRAEVNGNESDDVELEMLEGVFEFVAAATDKFFGSGKSELIRFRDGIAGFAGGLTIDERLTGHDGAFGLFATFADSPIHQCLIHTRHVLSVAVA